MTKAATWPHKMALLSISNFSSQPSRKTKNELMLMQHNFFTAHIFNILRLHSQNGTAIFRILALKTVKAMTFTAVLRLTEKKER